MEERRTAPGRSRCPEPFVKGAVDTTGPINAFVATGGLIANSRGVRDPEFVVVRVLSVPRSSRAGTQAGRRFAAPSWVATGAFFTY